MMRSLFSAVSGLKNHQTAMDVIGNNVANVNTVAFKSKKVVFQDIISQTVSSATAPTTTTGGMNAKQVGLGMSIATIATDITEGSTQTTSAPLDFAITGEGYFIVQGGDGTKYYTRNGNFTTDSQGYLVTANGDYVMAVTGSTGIANGTTPSTLSKIQILGTIGGNTYSEYAIDSSGVVTAKRSTGTIDTLGRIALATFNNAAGLENVGASKYQQSSNSGTAVYHFANDNAGKVQSGQLEMSNVQLANELTNMIIMQRGYQANSRVITTSDTMLEELINLKR